MSSILSSLKSFINKFGSENRVDLDRTISSVEAKTQEVAITRINTLSESASFKSDASSAFYSFFSARPSGEMVKNPLFNDDDEFTTVTDSAVDANTPPSPSILSEIIDSPLASPTDPIATEEEASGTMIIGSMIINEEESQEDLKPSFLLHSSAIVTGHEWEEILEKEEDRISAERIRESIFGDPSEYIHCSINDSKYIEEVVEDSSKDITSSVDVDKLIAANRCKVSVGLVQSRIEAFQK